MSPFRALVVAVIAFVVMGALGAFWVGVPIWAVFLGALVAAVMGFLLLGWLTRRAELRRKTEV
jgi:pilus assembly protein TadC